MYFLVNPVNWYNNVVFKVRLLIVSSATTFNQCTKQESSVQRERRGGGYFHELMGIFYRTSTVRLCKYCEMVFWCPEKQKACSVDSQCRT